LSVLPINANKKAKIALELGKKGERMPLRIF
jgi:hypothetical protein